MNRNAQGLKIGSLLSRRNAAAALAGVAGVTLLTGSLVSAAAVPHAAKSADTKVLKPDFNFFKGKTITYIVPNAPGTTSGIQIASMQAGLEAYLHATINIQYNTAISTVGQDVVGSSAPDGLTLGDGSLATDLNNIYSGTGALSFSLQKASFVGATYQAPDLLVACTGSPISSFSQLVHSVSAASVLNIASGPANELEHVLMSAFNIPHKYLSGYTASTLLVGCERGDGLVAATAAGTWLNAAGTAVIPGLTPLLLTGPEPKGSPADFLENLAPTIASFAKKNPPKTRFGKAGLKIAEEAFSASSPTFATFGPPGIPKARLLALTDAWRAVSKQASVKQAYLVAGLPPGFVPPSSILTYIKSQIKHQSLIQQYLNT